MCTVSWDSTPERDHLWFNRDEQRTRSAGLLPYERRTPKGVRILVPKDPDGGGTWIGGNEHGLLVCVLNAYDLGLPQIPPQRSRGLVVLDLLETKRSQEALETLTPIVRDQEIAPCRIFIWATGESPKCYEIFERRVSKQPLLLPMLTTSSYLPGEVSRWRTQAYQEASSQEQFHALRHPDQPAYGVWMSREDAHTVSQTRIDRTKERICFSYRTSPDALWSEVAFPLTAH